MTLKEYALKNGATEKAIRNGCPNTVILDFEKLVRQNPDIRVGCQKTKSCEVCWGNHIKEESGEGIKAGDIVEFNGAKAVVTLALPGPYALYHLLLAEGFTSLATEDEIKKTDRHADLSCLFAQI